MKKRIANGLLFASLISFFLIAVSLVLMAFGGREAVEAKLPLKLICGISFWAFLLIGVIMQIVLSIYVRNWAHQRSITKKIKLLNINPRLGLVSFFRNRLGTLSDIAFVISGAALLVSYTLSHGSSIVAYFSLALMVFFFCAHCIFNGKNYCYISNQQLIEESDSKKMEESK